uniref:Teneurin-3 (Trinotate prediction) n=1 Tax=Henneguya salminicola TaxID=69463 RepID=A0A6G3MDZ4_HENSL
MKLIICVYIFITQITNLRVYNNFDADTKDINIIATAKIFDFKNIDNTGPYGGCCGEYDEFLCFPCQYSIIMNLYKMIPYGGHEDSVVGFTENTPIVFEEGSKIKIDKGCSSVQFRFENLNKQKYIFDSTEWFGLHLSINYILDGAFGVKGIIKMYLNIEVFLIDRNSKFSFSFFKINTILWNNNKFIDNTCCSEDSNCQTSCPHNFLFSLGGKIFSESEAFIKRNKLKTAYYDYYCLFEHKDLTIKKKMDIIFSIVSNMESKQFDKILIKNFSFPPNYISSKINIGGMYGNLVTNLIMGNSCNGYTSDNCVNICYAIKYIEKCVYKTGNIKCINGAKDLKTCEKHKLKCEDDACNGNGICMINKNRITCKCKKGYYGKYCENWYCNKNCNNNGICEGPYTCHCYPFYHGKHCDMYQVDKNMDPEINKTKLFPHATIRIMLSSQ